MKISARIAAPRPAEMLKPAPRLTPRPCMNRAAN
jgi:hypothetical protein